MQKGPPTGNVYSTDDRRSLRLTFLGPRHSACSFVRPLRSPHWRRVVGIAASSRVGKSASGSLIFVGLASERLAHVVFLGFTTCRKMELKELRNNGGRCGTGNV